MRFSARARADLAALRHHFCQLGRPEAARNLSAALRHAAAKIARGDSLPAPRPYPELQGQDRAWVHAGAYWVAHTTTKPVTIIAVFYDTADIPGRFSPW